MKKLISFASGLFILSFLTGCGSNNGNGGSIAPDKTTNNPGVQTTENHFVFDSTTIHHNINPDKKQMPYKGTLLTASQWTDLDGENFLIFSQKAAFIVDKEQELSRAEFYACCYVKSNDQYVLQWEITDFVDQCMCDCEVTLKEETITITDVDKDGVAENLFIYRLDDRCDASPVSTKLIMHKGKIKLAIRGFSEQFLGPSEGETNQFRKELGLKPVKFKDIDPAFDSQPVALKNYASSFWDNYIKEENKVFQKQQGF